MKAVGVCGLAGIVGGGIYLNGAEAVGVTYPRTPDEVVRLVSAVELPGYMEAMLDQASTQTGTIERAVDGNRAVNFSFKVDGVQVATYAVTVVAADPGKSRVTTTFTMAPDAKAHMKSMIFPAAKQLAAVGKPVLDESVDAALDGRPVDQMVYQVAMTGFTAANMQEMGAGLQATFADVAAQLKEAEGAGASYDSLPSSRSTPSVRARYSDPTGTVRFVPGKPMVSAKTPSSSYPYY